MSAEVCAQLGDPGPHLLGESQVLILEFLILLLEMLRDVNFGVFSVSFALCA